MKNSSTTKLGIYSLLNKLLLSSSLFIFFGLTSCGDSGSSPNKNQNPNIISYSNPAECANQAVPVGIPGNTACPYKGEYDPNHGYQPYAVNYSASYGIGFKIDFGWNYEDMCPQVGQLPIFQNGQFSHCTGVNPDFARTGRRDNNLGECAGEQYNPEITGCNASLRPIPVNQPYFY